jgi:uncharacterized protein
MDDPLPPGAVQCTDLEYWASLGNVKRVAEALESNADVNLRGVDGYTAMHAAAENGHVEVLKFLVARGAALSPRLDTGETPLALALMASDRAEVVTYLRSLGAG